MTFRATLETRGGGGHVLELPFDAKAAFGRVRAPVRVTVKGHTFRTTTMRYGGVDYIGLNREVRTAAGVAGDRLPSRWSSTTSPAWSTRPRSSTGR